MGGKIAKENPAEAKPHVLNLLPYSHQICHHFSPEVEPKVTILFQHFPKGEVSYVLVPERNTRRVNCPYSNSLLTENSVF